LGVAHGAFCLFLGLVAIGCGAAPDENAEGPLRLVQAPVVTKPEAQLFAVSEFPLSVCFRNGFNGNISDATPADWAVVRQRVEGAWENLPRSAVDFTGWGACPENDAGYIKVFMGSMISRGNTPWRDGTRAGIMRITLGSSDYDAYTTIHEFGHAIGLEHEQLHPDKPPECTASQAGESLDADDEVLTTYDPDGVMNYCGPSPTKITAKEALFAEMAYPSTTTDHPLALNGFDTAEGWVILVDAELQTDWTRRGALPAAHPSVVWHASGSTYEAQSLSALPGTYALDYEFVDFRGQSHTSVKRDVVVDNGQYAALAMTITG
jgi:hypothetical protein